MIVFNGFDKFKNPLGKSKESIVTLGSFDGLHKGHLKLVEKSLEYRESLAVPSIAVTFSNKKSESGVLLNRVEAYPEKKILSDHQKIRAFQELGFNILVDQELTETFKKISHNEFERVYLKSALKPEVVVVGENFRYGYQRKGGTSELSTWGKQENVKTDIISTLYQDGQPISSTRIRQALTTSGDVCFARRLTTRPFFLEGCIKKGDQIGRTLGTPTANLGSISQLLPKAGIYAGKIWLSERPLKNSESLFDASFPSIINPPLSKAIPAVFNIGRRPTLKKKDDEVISVEGHLLAGKYDLDSLYEFPAVFYFLARLRDEVKFDSLDHLKKQIDEDKKNARTIIDEE